MHFKCAEVVFVHVLLNSVVYDRYMQSCIRTVFLITVMHDIELLVCHAPGTSLVVADALSRSHKGEKFRKILDNLGCLEGKVRLKVDPEYFRITD